MPSRVIFVSALSPSMSIPQVCCSSPSMFLVRYVFVSMCASIVTPTAAAAMPACPAPATGYYFIEPLLGAIEIFIESTTTMSVSMYVIGIKDIQSLTPKRTMFKTRTLAYSFDPTTCKFSFGAMPGHKGSIAKMIEFGSAAPLTDFSSITSMYAHIKSMYDPIMGQLFPSELTGAVDSNGSIRMLGAPPMARRDLPQDFVGYLQRAAARDQWTITPAEIDFVSKPLPADRSGATGISTWLYVVALAIAAATM